MSAVGPWDTPIEEPHGAGSHRWMSVLGVWGAAGAAVGSAVGGVLQVTQGMAGASSTWGTLGIGIGAAVGAAALVVERRAAEERPMLVDASGRASRPLHGLLFAGPVLAAIPALLVLGVVATVGIGHVAPAIAFGITALAVAWAGVRVWSTHRFTTALEAVERGDLGAARDRLQGLAGAWVATRSARSAARLNLGMMALQQGDGSEALRWYDQVGGRSASAWAKRRGWRSVPPSFTPTTRARRAPPACAAAGSASAAAMTITPTRIGPPSQILPRRLAGRPSRDVDTTAAPERYQDPKKPSPLGPRPIATRTPGRSPGRTLAWGRTP